MISLLLRHVIRPAGILCVLAGVLASTKPLIAAQPDDCARVDGRVLDATTLQPLSHVNVYIPELRIGEGSHSDGEFHLDHIQAGRWTLVASRVGYRDIRRSLVLDSCDSLVLELLLQPSPTMLAELQVTAESGEARTGDEAAVTRLNGEELQRHLGTTLAATLDEQAGITSRSMGPAPARPVLRGLSGDRLQLQEDGHAVGDLSSTSADHAVAIDPASARSVSLLRGPEALVHTGSSIGGVVDVQRGTIPPARAHGVSTTALLSLESGSSSMVAGASMDAPLGRQRIHVDGSWREGGDTRTPTGRLGNSSISTQGFSTGLRLQEGLGLEGLSFTLLESDYGIPGGFVGAHPGGVDIGMSRRNARARFGWQPGLSTLDHIELETTASTYRHVEYSKSGRIGISFDVQNMGARLLLHQRPAEQPRALLLGMEAARRSLVTGGLTQMPSVDQNNGALFLLKHWQPGQLTLVTAARLNHTTIMPERERISSVVGHIRERSFTGAGFSLRMEHPLGGIFSHSPDNALHGIRAGMLLNQGWRAPTMEELFSGGPHLAAYSYEIGNPELEAELGSNGELYLLVARKGLRSRLAVYATRWHRYIFPEFTGHFSSRRADLYEYRYTGQDAIHRGWELELEWTPAEPWSVNLELADVQGWLVDGKVPLPETPPLRGRLGMDWQNSLLVLGLSLEAADRQDRVYQSPAPDAIPEAATAGWARLDGQVSVRLVRGRALHSLMLSVDNLLDREYRDHLNRVRSVMPETGHSLRLSWKVYL
ncbi:MAG: TonB-dependent receptor [Candidatus Delongbacteria bacterium]|nr:TonB-dependent receptor [Candidatus Delongbacteria bacterium]